MERVPLGKRKKRGKFGNGPDCAEGAGREAKLRIGKGAGEIPKNRAS